MPTPSATRIALSTERCRRILRKWGASLQLVIEREPVERTYPTAVSPFRANRRKVSRTAVDRRERRRKGKEILAAGR